MVVEIMVPFLSTVNSRCRIIIGTQKGTIILATTLICYVRCLLLALVLLFLLQENLYMVVRFRV